MRVLYDYRESRTKSKRRIQILETARELFIEKGIHSVNVSDIAEVSGNSLRSIYNYYTTKEDIAIDVQMHEIDILFSIMQREYEDEETGYETMNKYLHRFVDDLIKNDSSVIFIAAFDYYFYNGFADTRYTDYASARTSDVTYVVDIIMKGIEDQSIKFIPEDEIPGVLQSIYGCCLTYAKRILYLRKKHHEDQFSMSTKNLYIFADLVLEGIKNKK